MSAMTLEELRDECIKCSYTRSAEAVDAAIRERDGLRYALAVEQDISKFADTYHSEYGHAIARAEKAEAELAALRKRIAEAQMETVNKPGPYWGGGASFGIVMALVDAKLIGRPVRLLVDDDA